MAEDGAKLGERISSETNDLLVEGSERNPRASGATCCTALDSC